MSKQIFRCTGMTGLLAGVGLVWVPQAEAVLVSTSLDYRSSAQVLDSNDPINVFDNDIIDEIHSGTSPLNVSADVAISGGTASYDLSSSLTTTSISAEGRAEFSVGGSASGGAENRWEFKFRLDDPALLSVSGLGSVVTPPNSGGLVFYIAKRFPNQTLAAADTRSGSLNFGTIWGGTRELDPGSYVAFIRAGTSSQRSGGTLVLADGFADVNLNLTFTPLGSLVGDYNGDGFVSQGDLDLILLNWGDTTLPTGFDTDALDGGGPFDGLMGQNELDGVLLNWGDGTPLGASAIPEPSAAVLLGSLVIIGSLRRRI